jgi:hypothetical protein
MSTSEVAAIERDLALAGRGVRDERPGLRGEGEGEGSMRGGVGGRREKVFCCAGCLSVGPTLQPLKSSRILSISQD